MENDKQVIDQNLFDQKDYEAFLDPEGGSPEARELVAKGAEKYAAYEPLLRDAYMSLYKARPRLRDADEVQAEFHGNRAIMNEALRSGTYQSLRARTQGKPDISAVSTLAMGQELLKNIPDDVKKAVNEAAKQQADAEKRLEEARKALEEGDGSEEDLQKLQEELAQQKAEAQQAMQEAMEGAEAGVHAAVMKATKAGQKEADEYMSALAAWGTGQGGALQTMPWRERMQLAQRISKSEKLRGVAAMLGRFREMALGKSKERSRRVATEVVGIELGRDVSRLVPSSLVTLAVPELQPVFMRDYSEGQLLQYKLEGMERKGRGPIVVCMDESGSMSGAKEYWAKAVALALAVVAHREKRACCIISFASSDQVKVRRIEKGIDERKYLETSIEVAEHFFCGDTDFEAPLNAALKEVEESPSYKEADVVFITDGICGVSPAFLKRWHEVKKKLNFSCISIQVGGDPRVKLDVLESFSDETLPLQPGDMVGDKEANGVFTFAA